MHRMRSERLSKRNFSASKKVQLAATAHALLYKIISTLAWQILNHIFRGKLQFSHQKCQFIVRAFLPLFCFVKVKYSNTLHPHDHSDREVSFVRLHQSHIYLHGHCHGHWLIYFFFYSTFPSLRLWNCLFTRVFEKLVPTQFISIYFISNRSHLFPTFSSRMSCGGFMSYLLNQNLVAWSLVDSSLNYKWILYNWSELYFWSSHALPGERRNAT